ncbi:MAG: hypothetical protein PHQ26_04530 [Bacteroidales bacterium]|nr:hypothetical protein [Bacteroidales bacterium]MDD4770726.1 hypothetical protein [Bacteroidales bacterium]
MGYRILSAKDFNVNLKCSIHKTGKFGFTGATADKLGLSRIQAVKFAIDDESDDVMYLIPSMQGDEDAFKVNKAGNYYYVFAKVLFDSLNLDYVKNSIMFDLTELKEGEAVIYKMKRRSKPRK